MKKILCLFSIFLITITLTMSFLPVFAAKPADVREPVIGDKTRLDKHTEITYKGKDKTGKYIYEATISSLPAYLDDLKTKIDPGWKYTGTGTFETKDNLFKATAKDTTVTISYNKSQMTLNPTVTINKVVQKPVGTQASLINDYYNLNYKDNILQWDYKTFKRQVRVIEGGIFEYLVFDKNPNGDVNIGKPVKDLGFTYDRPVEAWDLNGEPLQVNDNLISASEFNRPDIVYPVTIDPSPTFTTSASDGFLYISEGVYNTAWTAAGADTVYYSSNSFIVGQLKSGSTYYLDRAAVFFDTSSLPDAAVLTAGTLSLYGRVDDSDTNFDITVTNGQPTYPRNPMVVGDYNKTHYAGSGGTLTTVGFSITGYNNLALDATGLSWISLTGTSKLVLRSSRDIAGTAPTGEENVTVWSYEKGTGYQPTLTLTYATTAPSITANAASSIASTTARLNSIVNDDGGEACDVRFGYGTTSLLAANFALYDTITGWVSGYTIGQQPFVDVTTLIPATTYYYRAQIKNTDSTVTSANEITFATEAAIADPSEFRAYPSSTSVELSWTLGAGSSQSLVRYSFTAYPATTADGTQLYLGANNNTTHTGLTAGTTIYYSVWGESGGAYSVNAANTMATTSASSETTGTMPTPGQPTGWFQSPNYANMSNFEPIYTMVNGLADAFAMPRATAWYLWAMFISMLAGGIVLAISKHLAGGLVAMCIVIAVGWQQELIPLVMMLATVIPAVGILIIRRQF